MHSPHAESGVRRCAPLMPMWPDLQKQPILISHFIISLGASPQVRTPLTTWLVMEQQSILDPHFIITCPPPLRCVRCCPRGSRTRLCGRRLGPDSCGRWRGCDHRGRELPRNYRGGASSYRQDVLHARGGGAVTRLNPKPSVGATKVV